METPEYISISNQVLIEEFVTTVQNQLKQLPWLVQVHGLVQKGIHDDGLEYPQIFKLESTKNDSYDIRPDSSLASYCFFELVDSMESDDSLTKCEFNLIVWGNVKLIKPTIQYDRTNVLMQEVIKKVKKLFPLWDIDIFNVRLFTRSENVFNYSGILQKDTQYMMKPYFGFRVNFSVYLPNCG